MTLPLFFFYLFSAIAVASAFMVISSRNPVHAVLFLILTFVNAAGLFMIAGAEFLALLLIVVYVGAVAVLFLFVVMMLDVDFAQMRQGMLQYAPVGVVVGAILLLELLLVAAALPSRPMWRAERHCRSMRPWTIRASSATCSTRATSSSSRGQGRCCWWP